MNSTPRVDRWLTFDRTDFIGTRLIAGIIAVAVPLFQLLLPVVDWVRGRALQWTLVSAADPGRVTGLRPGVTGKYDGTIRVTIPDAGTGVWLSSLLPGLVLTLATLVGLWLVLRLLRVIQSGQPFVAGSVWWLRGIAALLLATPVLLLIAQSIADLVVRTAATTADSTVRIAFLGSLPTLVLMIAGLLVAAIAEAFARGAVLQDDVEGLI